MPVRSYDPLQGQAFQGDVTIIPIPDDVAIATNEEIPPVEGRLIIQAGERSGHHHAIDLFNRFARFRDDGLARSLSSKSGALRTQAPAGAPRATAHFYRDAAAARLMVTRGLLTRSDLAIGCLVVQGGAVVITHEEHDGIRVPPGNYLVGRQIEGSLQGEPRMIGD
jgi:hypothetical protein